jgi:CRP-like cAMP-binding protein
VEKSNLLLAALSPGDRALIEPRLKPIHLEQTHVIYSPGDTVNAVYFPLNAIVSLVVELSDGGMIEAAMVGRDGVVGASSALDGRVSLNRAIVQIGGDALVCDVPGFKGAVLQSESLLSLVMRHEQAVYGQAQQSAACNASHHVEARLCRWMLRARDLSGSDVLPFTQEFLAEMLGVRRTSVSVVAHTLQQAGFIKYIRGRIQIINVDGLEQAACECYGTVKAHYDALLGQYVDGGGSGKT